MKQFYHLYVVINNDKVNITEDIDELRLIDQLWSEILEKEKVHLTPEELQQIAENIKKSLS